jgi:hypothetical protein
MGRKPNKIPEPPEWLLIAKHDALLTAIEIGKILGVDRVGVIRRVTAGIFPKPDVEHFDKHEGHLISRRGSSARRVYWKVSTVRKFLKQQVQNQIDELKQQLQERAQ